MKSGRRRRRGLAGRRDDQRRGRSDFDRDPAGTASTTARPTDHERPPPLRLRLQPDRNTPAASAKGELGGLVFRGDCRYPRAMACYGDRLGALTLEKPLHASGRVVPAPRRHRQHDADRLLPLRDSMAATRRRTPALPESFLGVAIEGPSREGFYFYPAYRARQAAAAAHGLTADGAAPHLSRRQAPRWTLDYRPRRRPAAAAGSP